MRKVIIPLVLLVWMAGTALADTLYLKNGSVMNGTFITFERGEFVLDVTDGDRVRISADRVSRLVIDRDAISRGSRRENYPRRDSDNPPYSRDSTGRGWESADVFDVSLREQWKRSPIQVYRGQRVRVEASGTITLEGRGTLGPDGSVGKRDSDAPMPDENDGALVAAIGHDFDSPMIFIGRSSEFVAERDGVLYFTVNHRGTASSRGSFSVNVSLDRSSGYSSRRPAASTYRAQGREKTVTVSADQAWTDTGIDLESNMMIEIVADGRITISRNRQTGPDGDLGTNASTSVYPISGKGVGAVIAKIRYRSGRDSSNVFIGSRGQLYTESNESGRLFIGINDDVLRDNNGSYSVTIRW